MSPPGSSADPLQQHWNRPPTSLQAGPCLRSRGAAQEPPASTSSAQPLSTWSWCQSKGQGPGGKSMCESDDCKLGLTLPDSA